jgi:pyruvate carboxylase
VKVTPTSKVVGDMALMMVANDLTPDDVASPTHDTAFPESVVSLFRGELGFPPDGFPPAMSRKVLKLAEGEAPPAAYRPGDRLPPVDLEAARSEAEQDAGLPLDDRQLASALMYPKVAREFQQHLQKHGDTSVLPTPTFFYGLRLQDDVALEIDPGKTLLVSLQGIHDDEAAGAAKVQFELNGQSRTVITARAGASSASIQREIAEPGNPLHVGAPMPGAIVTVAIQAGQTVRAGSTLLSLEAMKMESHIIAERDCVVERVLVKPGDRVQAKDLLVVLKD